MSSLSYNTGLAYIVNALWEIDSANLEKQETITTETKTVEGMPDVKWSLKCVPNNNAGYYYDRYGNYGNHSESFEIYLNVESETEISFKVENTREKCFVATASSRKAKKPRIAGSSVQDRIVSVEERIVTGQDEYCIEEIQGWKNYLSNGKLDIQFSATFSYTKQSVSGIPKLGNSNAWGLRLKQNNSEDFNIIVDKQTITIHKTIICAESPVFKQMFEGNFVEAKKNQVTIPDFKYEVVQAAIDYCYAQDISACFESDDNVHQLLTFSDKYDFQTLKPALEKYLATKLTKENISFYASAADKANALDLRKSCVEYVKNLLKKGKTFTSKEMATFDTKFMADVLSQAMTKDD